MSAKTSSLLIYISVANSNSNSIPKALSRSGYGPAAPAFRHSSPRQVSAGKEIRDFDGESYVMERGLVADLAIIHAWRADREGNLVYRKTARNFNPVMATAAKVTVAEVEHLVEPGIIDPDHIHTPGIFVKRIVRSPSYEKRIEQRTVRKRGN
jgi:3-oxoacid CoA-transferase subunit A